MTAMLQITEAAKTFTMHLQGGIRLPVVAGVSFAAHPGECVVLAGPSGAGKSSILKIIFGNYRCDAGKVAVRHQGNVVDIASAEPREILQHAQSSRSAMSASSCARCRACRRSTWWPSR